MSAEALARALLRAAVAAAGEMAREWRSGLLPSAGEQWDAPRSRQMERADELVRLLNLALALVRREAD